MTGKQIRDALISQLERKGAKIDTFSDMVDDYMKFWKIKNKLSADINKRGVVYEDRSSVGVMMQKNNPSVKELVMVNKSMLTILQQLDISTKNIVGEKDDEM